MDDDDIFEISVRELLPKPEYDFMNRFKNDYDLCISSTQRETSKDLFDSIWLVDNHDYAKKMLTNDGRFLIFSYCDSNQKSYILIRDLFYGVQRINPVSILMSETKQIIDGKYLLCFKFSDNDECHKLYALKINYDDLSVEELKTIDMEADFYYTEILPDHLDSQKFVVCDDEKMITGQICNEEIVVGNVKNFEENDMYGKRLIGNSMQGFTQIYDTGALKFCEFNLNTLEKKLYDIPVELIPDEFDITDNFPHTYCWSKNYFYGMFQMSIVFKQYQLLMFDTKTLKWTDIEMSIKSPIGMYVNSNEILTLQVGRHKEPNAFYRIGLKKPEKLMNKVLLFALQQSNFCGNDKYINTIRSFQIPSVVKQQKGGKVKIITPKTIIIDWERKEEVEKEIEKRIEQEIKRQKQCHASRRCRIQKVDWIHVLEEELDKQQKRRLLLDQEIAEKVANLEQLEKRYNELTGEMIDLN